MEGRGTSSSPHAIDTGACAPMDGWNTLPWKKFQRQVFKLQQRIYRASHRGDATSEKQRTTFAAQVRMTNAMLLRSRMKPKLHVRFWSRAGMATFRLRQRGDGGTKSL